MLNLILSFFRSFGGKFIAWIGPLFIVISDFLTKTAIKLFSGIIPIIWDFVKKSLKIMFFVVFIGAFLNLTSTLIAFLLYHINLTVAVGLSGYVTQFTVNLLSYYILGIMVLVVGKGFYNLIKD